MVLKNLKRMKNNISGNYIEGEWLESDASESFDNINPCNEEKIGRYPKTTEKEVGKACAAARRAFHSWKNISRVKRAEYLYRVAKIIEERTEELARAISMETGKNYNESIAEVNEALHMAQFAFGSGRYSHGEAVSSEIEDKDTYMLRKPKP